MRTIIKRLIVSVIATTIIVALGIIFAGYAPCSWYDLNSANTTAVRQVLTTCWN